MQKKGDKSIFHVQTGTAKLRTLKKREKKIKPLKRKECLSTRNDP